MSKIKKKYLDFEIYEKYEVDTISGSLQQQVDNKVENALNLGVGEGIYTAKSGVDLQFKSLTGGTNITLISDDNNITISGSGSTDHIHDHGTLTGRDNDDHPQYGGITTTETISGSWTFNPDGSGGITAYDISIGDTDGSPTYGIARIGDSIIGRTSYNVASLDLDGSFLIRNVGTPLTSNIEFIVADSSSTIRFALAKPGVGNATYNPRSMLIAGPAVLDDTVVTVGYWQSQGIFDNLVCDTSGAGADLGVQNDLEVEGDIFVDSILESTTSSGVSIDGAIIKDGSILLSNGTTINEFSIDGILFDNSDDAAPTEQAVKTYVDTISGSLQQQVNAKPDSDHLHTLVSLTDTPAVYDNGKYLKSTDSGVIWATASGEGLFTEDVSNNIVGGTGAGTSIAAGGIDNFLAGTDAGYSQTTADNNIIIGNDARYYNVTGVNNIAIGYQAGYGATGQSAHNCVFIGSWSGLSEETGAENVAIGSSSLRFNETGANNTCVGHQAGYGATGQSHDNNTFIGHHSGYSITTGDVNACLGYRAGYGITTGSYNVYIGDEAGYASDTGIYNVAIGYVAGRGTLTDLNRYNTFVGAWAGYIIETAEYNTVVGYGSGQALTTGDNNTLLGTQTGDNITTGSNNLIIGYNIDPLSATADNQFALGTGTYPFLRGDMSTYQLAIYGANGYLNFNTSLGEDGYGFRDNAGLMEYRDSGADWVAFATISGTGGGVTHTHYDADMTYVADSTWSYSGDTFSGVPSDLQVFFNGVKNRASDSDYYTPTVSGTDLVVVFAYPTSSADWTNITYTE